MTELQNNLYSEYNDQKLYSEYNDQKLYSEYNDQNQHEGYAVGNWRSHIIIDCAQCHKPMGSHTSDEAVCNECTTNNLKEGER